MDKRMHELKISDKLSSLMPPLSAQEEQLLTESLLDAGCREPLVVWNGTIVDGHNRYRICWRHGIPFTYTEMDFESESAAILWAIKNQIARRNLTPFQRCELVMPYEESIKAEAKKRQGWRSDKRSMPDEAGTTRDYLARMAGVSGGTLSKAKAVMDKADAEIITQAREGVISIHRAYLMVSEKPGAINEGDGRTEPAEVPDKTPCVVAEDRADIDHRHVGNESKTTADILNPIGEAVHSLLCRVMDGDVTTKTIIAELFRVTEMIDGARGEKVSHGERDGEESI